MHEDRFFHLNVFECLIPTCYSRECKGAYKNHLNMHRACPILDKGIPRDGKQILCCTPSLNLLF
jgi:hypothetical protein